MLQSSGEREEKESGAEAGAAAHLYLSSLSSTNPPLSNPALLVKLVKLVKLRGPSSTTLRIRVKREVEAVWGEAKLVVGREREKEGGASHWVRDTDAVGQRGKSAFCVGGPVVDHGVVVAVS